MWYLKLDAAFIDFFIPHISSAFCCVYLGKNNQGEVYEFFVNPAILLLSWVQMWQMVRMGIELKNHP